MFKNPSFSPWPIIALLLSLTTAFAQAETEEKCLSDTHDSSNPPVGLDDPFYPAARMPFGRMKGRCIDTSAQRPTRFLTLVEQKKYGGPYAGHVMVPNFHHLGRFWIARIPVNAVNEVIYQLDHWGLLAEAGNPMKGPDSGHGQLRFRFAAPVILTPQVPSLNYPAKELAIYDMDYSFQIAGVKGQGWGLRDGALGHLAVVAVLTSHEGKAKYFLEQGHRVSQWSMNLSSSEGEQLLMGAIVRSQEIGLHTRYNSVYNHCVSGSLDLLDRTFGGKKPGYRLSRYPWEVLRDLRPSRVESSLAARGLINADGTSEMQELNDEFPQWDKVYRQPLKK